MTWWLHDTGLSASYHRLGETGGFVLLISFSQCKCHFQLDIHHLNPGVTSHWLEKGFHHTISTTSPGPTLQLNIDFHWSQSIEHCFFHHKNTDCWLQIHLLELKLLRLYRGSRATIDGWILIKCTVVKNPFSYKPYEPFPAIPCNDIIACLY